MPPQQVPYSAPYTDPTVSERQVGGQKEMSLREPGLRPTEINGTRISSSDSLDVPSAARGADVGRRAQPIKAPPDVEGWKKFRRTCDELLAELKRVDDYFEDDVVSEAGSGVILELESLLEQLYSYPWGAEECLKRIVVAIQTQINNARWTRRHVAFLKEVVRELRARYTIDEAEIAEVKEAIKRHGLNIFRGTVAEPTDAVRKYRIVEVSGA